MRRKKIEVWKSMRNDIAYISRRTHHTRHILLYEFSIAVWQYHSQCGSIIRALQLCYFQFSKAKKRDYVFPEIPPNETTFFVNIFRESCNLLETTIARSTILSELCSVHYCRIEISSVPTTQRAL